MRIAFYGSSLLSAYWNGAATYYRGLLRELAARGYQTTFYEPDAFDRQSHRDIDPPDWARVMVYPATETAARAVIARAAEADVVVKASGVGVFDDLLLEGVMAAARPQAVKIFWDVDAAATLTELRHGPELPLRRMLPGLDLVLTYGGGPPVIAGYQTLGARACRPIYNALDPETHHPVAAEAGFAGDLNFLANRLPDRETRMERFFLEPAARLPERRFLLGGAGWDDKPMPSNVRRLGHVGTADHNAVNCSALAVLNVAGTPWPTSASRRRPGVRGGRRRRLPDHRRLGGRGAVPAPRRRGARRPRRTGSGRAAGGPDATRARAIGEAARRRVLSEHTYARRGDEVDALLRREVAAKRERSLA